MPYNYKTGVYVKESLSAPEEFRELIEQYNGFAFSDSSRNDELFGKFHFVLLKSPEPVAIEDLRARFCFLTIDSLVAAV